MFNHNIFNQNNINLNIKNNDINFKLNLTLDEIFNGGTKLISFTKKMLCTKCSQSQIKNCTSCNGTGIQRIIQQMGPFLQNIQRICNICEGKGKKIINNKNCDECKGNIFKTINRNLNINIKRGISNTHKIIVQQEGNQGIDSKKGNLVIEINQLEHNEFMRHNNDLFITKKISLYDYLFKNPIEIQHLDFRKFNIELTNAEILMIKKEGMFIYDKIDRGNLYIILEIIYPENKISKNIKINLTNNMISLDKTDVLINNNELLSLLFNQPNKKISNNDVIKTEKIDECILINIKLYILNLKKGNIPDEQNCRQQ
jgi:DnaJ family protein A protein 2